MKTLLFIIISFFTVNHAFAEIQEFDKDHSYFSPPATLYGQQLTLEVETITPEDGLPFPLNYLKPGTLIERFDEQHIVSRGFDVHFIDYYSEYTYKVLNQNTATYKSEFSTNVLTFISPKRGTFVYDLGNGLGAMKGSFSIRDTNLTGLAPETVKNNGFSMIVTQKDPSFPAEDLPPFDQMLNHYFGKNKVYIRSEQYDEWEYEAKYKENRQQNNSTILDVKFPRSNLDYTLTFSYQNMRAGTWKITTKGSDASISGNFTYTLINPPTNLKYKGTIAEKQSYLSQITGINYPYRVYLPKGYDSDKEYPVIYATDGQWVFWDFSKEIDKSGYDFILVAIEQGPNNRRIIDYTITGANDYIQFFKTEFMPYIESQYRISDKNRTIQGASLGGLIVSSFLYDHNTTPSFQNYISSDGAYQLFKPDYIAVEEALLPSWSGSGVNLFLDSASAAGLVFEVEKYYDRMNSYQLPGLQIHLKERHLTHVQIALPAFKDAIEYIDDVIDE